LDIGQNNCGSENNLKAFSLYNSNNITKTLEMGCLHMQGCNSYAVSDIIGIVMVLLIITTGISITLLWGVPYLEEQKTTISLDSALLQLDVIGDAIEGVFRDGVNSSKTMNFKAGSGNLYINQEGERFVFYYSVYTEYYTIDPDRYFNFEIYDLNDEDNYVFRIEIINDIGAVDLFFNVTRLNDSEFDSVQVGGISNGNPTDVGPFIFPILGGVRIDIVRDNPDPGPDENYGRIWLFDIGSINYKTNDPLNSKRAIVENGGVISAVGTNNGYPYNEPSYWSQTLLDDRNIFTMRLIKTVSDNYTTVGITEPEEIELAIKATNSTALESRQFIDRYFKMKIYGDEAVVNAWCIFYQNRMEFKEYTHGGEEGLKLEFNPQTTVGNFPLFSFNYAICNVDMEVKS
jgi:hypothetical protein